MRLTRLGTRITLVHRPWYQWGFGIAFAAVVPFLVADLLAPQPAAPGLWVHLAALAGFVYVAARMLIAPQTAVSFDRATRRVGISRRGLLGISRQEIDCTAVAGFDVQDFDDEDGAALRARLLVANGPAIALTAASRSRGAAQADRTAAEQAFREACRASGDQEQ
jgi:hypothetical protein